MVKRWAQWEDEGRKTSEQGSSPLHLPPSPFLSHSGRDDGAAECLDQVLVWVNWGQ